MYICANADVDESVEINACGESSRVGGVNLCIYTVIQLISIDISSKSVGN